ncbi:MAG: hypothetical protein A2Y53_07170 [Chloroflexi bacterium RBG_16_47_49]|nr:MAG: hypothetical protein A2Y53_07170 [Chloroflexi bacterium RBG_16_47_49]
MKANDKVLIGIVVGIVILIITALVITLMKPEPTYLAEDTPEGVAHNYLLAIQQEDYERAYGYLSPTLVGYPRLEEEFIEDIQNNSWSFRLDRSTTLSVEASTITGSKSNVTVRELSIFGDDLFNSGQSTNNFEMNMHRISGEWKIVDSNYYFASCWEWESGCPHK